MQPVTFRGANKAYKTATGHVPVLKHRDMVTMCWRLTFMERIKVLFTGNIWAVLRTFKKPPMPLVLLIKKPFTRVDRDV